MGVPETIVGTRPRPGGRLSLFAEPPAEIQILIGKAMKTTFEENGTSTVHLPAEVPFKIFIENSGSQEIAVNGGRYFVDTQDGLSDVGKLSPGSQVAIAFDPNEQIWLSESLKGLPMTSEPPGMTEATRIVT